MDFEFSPEQQAFAAEVEAFLDEQRRPRRLRPDPGEHGADRRHAEAARVHGASSASGAGSGSPGRRSTAAPRARASTSTSSTRRSPARGGPQIGKGVGIIGKTLIAHGSDFLKEKFLPMILRNDVEFAVGYSEPNAGSDAASMRLKAERARAATASRAGSSTARRRGPRPRTSPSGTGSARAPIPTTSTAASR